MGEYGWISENYSHNVIIIQFLTHSTISYSKNIIAPIVPNEYKHLDLFYHTAFSLLREGERDKLCRHQHHHQHHHYQRALKINLPQSCWHEAIAECKPDFIHEECTNDIVWWKIRSWQFQSSLWNENVFDHVLCQDLGRLCVSLLSLLDLSSTVLCISGSFCIVSLRRDWRALFYNGWRGWA